MTREQATAKIARIIGDIEKSHLRKQVKELHVFGSYARGATTVGDLDLVLVVEPPSPRHLRRLAAEAKAGCQPNLRYCPPRMLAMRRFHNRISAKIRRPGEKIDILLGDSLQQVLGLGKTIAMSRRVLLWTPSDRQWESKIDAIKANAAATRFERGHFADLRMFNGDLEMMEAIGRAIRARLIRLTRIDAACEKAPLNDLYQYWHDHWVNCGRRGRESAKLLRHALWWIQHQRGQAKCLPNPWGRDTIIVSEDRKYLVHFGRPSLYMIHQVSRYTRICLIPHFKRDRRNELFVFEKGSRFSQRRLDALR